MKPVVEKEETSYAFFSVQLVSHQDAFSFSGLTLIVLKKKLIAFQTLKNACVMLHRNLKRSKFEVMQSTLI